MQLFCLNCIKLLVRFTGIEMAQLYINVRSSIMSSNELAILKFNLPENILIYKKTSLQKYVSSFTHFLKLK